MTKETPLELIKNSNIKEAVIGITEDYGHNTDEYMIDYRNGLANAMINLFRHVGLIQDGYESYLSDCIIASCLLHNVFEKEHKNDVGYLFLIREVLMDEYSQIPEQYIEAICSVIESQEGISCPVPSLRPKPSTPQELFSNCKATYDFMMENGIKINAKSQ